jgi:hypothetical protein
MPRVVNASDVSRAKALATERHEAELSGILEFLIMSTQSLQSAALRAENGAVPGCNAKVETNPIRSFADEFLLRSVASVRENKNKKKPCMDRYRLRPSETATGAPP